MKKIIYIAVVGFFTGCAGFQTVTLTEDVPLAHFDSATMNAPSLPVMKYNGGIFLDSRTDISKWEPSHSNVIAGKSGSSLSLDLKEAGANWEQLYMQFQPLDFTGAPYLLVKAHVESGSKDSLKMRIDLIDENGYSTNYVPQERYIRARADSKIYKFSFDGNWVQNWPVRKDVDPKSIVGIKINFNGGGPNYSGKLIIDEIIAFDGKKKMDNPENYALFDFTDGTGGWWSANSITLGPEEVDTRDVMKLFIEESGPGWEGFGYKFGQPVDFSKTPVLMVRMKADKAGKLRIDIRDVKEYATNQQPAIIDFPETKEFTDIFFNYSGKFVQSWPNTQTVDSSKVTSLSCFVNPPPDNPAYTGNVIIDDIILMSVDEYNKLKK